RAIHTIGSRCSRPFVKLNCAAIPSGLLESELFGHAKGAFTGAMAQRIGRFELAHEGTLFLDEVGDIPLELQPKLLRVLQDREFEGLGSTRTIRVDVRLVAATNRDLAQMVGEKQFREDLYFRLDVFPIRIPPLRERVGDIPLLVRHYVDKYAWRMDKRIETIPGEAMEALCRHCWPGNIRELQNFIERAVILTPGSVLQVQLSELQQSSPVPSTPQHNGEHSAGCRAPAYSGGFAGRPALSSEEARRPVWASSAPLCCLKCKDSASPVLQNTRHWHRKRE